MNMLPVWCPACKRLQDDQELGEACQWTEGEYEYKCACGAVLKLVAFTTLEFDLVVEEGGQRDGI